MSLNIGVEIPVPFNGLGAATNKHEATENDKEAQMNPEEQAALQKIESLVANHPVVIFMKGTLDEPKCGFR